MHQQRKQEESKEEFYSKLQEQLVKVSNHDILIVLGDFNAKIGCDNTGYERNMGKHGLGTRNDNGERFLELCLENDLAIGGTLFQHKRIHKETSQKDLQVRTDDEKQSDRHQSTCSPSSDLWLRDC